MKIRSLFLLFAAVLCLATLGGCSGSSDPVTRLQASLEDKPEYAIILNDMRAEGNFVPSYYHQYRVDVGEKKEELPFQEVDEDVYKKYEPYLGMVLASKSADGTVYNTPFPNGYQYVGNPQYGQWRTDSSGGSFWEFYGKYMLLSQVMDWAGYGLSRRNYDQYASTRQSGKPYFGSKGQFGTEGTVTQKKKPEFYKRRSMRKASSEKRFQDKVNRRIGRSKNTFRSRGFSFGK